MKPAFRVIARLDIKDENLVKGINLEGLRVIGKPHDFANYYYQNGIDEILYQDVIASLLGRNNLKEIIAKSSKNIFVPITVGGGIKSLKDIENVLKSGADRVSLNSGVLENKNLIKDSIKNFGSSNIVFAIETINLNKNYIIVKHNGRERTEFSLLDWVKLLEDYGASEICLTSISNDGTGNGINYEILDLISDISSISLIYHGGVNSKDPEKLKSKNYKNLSGLVISSLFHYKYYLKQNHESNKFNNGNIEFMLKKKIPNNIEPIEIKEFKKKLVDNGIECSKYNV